MENLQQINIQKKGYLRHVEGLIPFNLDWLTLACPWFYTLVLISSDRSYTSDIFNGVKYCVLYLYCLQGYTEIQRMKRVTARCPL